VSIGDQFLAQAGFFMAWCALDWHWGGWLVFFASLALNLIQYLKARG